MEKKSPLDEINIDDMMRARLAFDETVEGLRSDVPLVTLMAALAETLADVTAMMMSIEQERCGSTVMTLSASAELLAILREQFQLHASRLMGSVDPHVH